MLLDGTTELVVVLADRHRRDVVEPVEHPRHRLADEIGVVREHDVHGVLLPSRRPGYGASTVLR
jgi:hypothetical protein